MDEKTSHLMRQTKVTELHLIKKQTKITELLVPLVTELKREQLISNELVKRLSKDISVLQTKMDRIQHKKKKRYFSLNEVLLKIQSKMFTENKEG